jgi:hypothetical protein
MTKGGFDQKAQSVEFCRPPMKKQAFGIADGYGAFEKHGGENSAQGAFWRAIRLAADAPQRRSCWMRMVLQARGDRYDHWVMGLPA